MDRDDIIEQDEQIEKKKMEQEREDRNEDDYERRLKNSEDDMD